MSEYAIGRKSNGAILCRRQPLPSSFADRTSGKLAYTQEKLPSDLLEPDEVLRWTTLEAANTALTTYRTAISADSTLFTVVTLNGPDR